MMRLREAARGLWRMAALLALGVALAGASAPAPVLACGVETDCALPEMRSYRVYLPETLGPPPRRAILHLHGYRGSAAASIRNRGLQRLADALGVALVAGKSFSDDWRIPGVPADPATDGAAELRYFDALLEDLATRYGVAADGVLVTGFSAGGMATWFFACNRGDSVAGFAPIAGTFWEPAPSNCPSPAAHVLHTHGLTDRIVPLEGRPIGPTRQGDVRAVMEMYAADKGFGPAVTETAESAAGAGLSCTRRLNAEGKALEICLHPRAHDYRAAYVRRAWETLETLGAL